MANVLIIDDDIHTCTILSDLVEEMGHNAEYALALEDGFQQSEHKPYDVIFLDVCFPEGSGDDYLPRFLAEKNRPEVIIMTSFGSGKGADRAIRSGAWNYLAKPLVPDEFIAALNHALQYREDLKKVPEPPAVLRRGKIIGKSSQISVCLDQVAQAAGGELNILITGETGTGKELFAEAIHNNSARAGKAFVTVDCAAIPDTLGESTLLGHVKGAFTGADRTRDGLIKLADRGTLFLDEVGELSLSLQKVFLRVLEQRYFRPVGAKQEVKSDFRLVAATNRNLEQMAREGSFRNDLLFRLNSLVIQLPPLRKRTGDIEELASHLSDRVCENLGIAPKGIAPEVMDLLSRHDWPGNVRELAHLIEVTVDAARYQPTIYEKHLPVDFRARMKQAAFTSPPPVPQSNMGACDFDDPT
ncbi:MAG: sigma-54-dependent transcriptional regulator, partial [Syntrophobacteraceae bacterium]